MNDRHHDTSHISDSTLALVLSHTVAYGGASLDLHTGELFSTDEKVFLVGGATDVLGHQIPTVHFDKNALNLGDLRRQASWWLRTAASESVILGTWIDPVEDPDDVLMDASEAYTDLDEAIAVARKRGETAIYDMQNGVDIRI